MDCLIVNLIKRLFDDQMTQNYSVSNAAAIIWEEYNDM
jgi:hypothetical protein